MEISKTSWQRYLRGLRKVNDTATAKMLYYIEQFGMPTNQDELADFIWAAFNISTKYGEAAAALAAEMYDAVALASDVNVAAAELAPTPTIAEVAKAVNGTLKTKNPKIVSEAVGRMVKMTGVDTTMKNALRDGAEWAWIPSGDTCAFCITLASRDWQRASKAAIKGGHAEHIHANCDCTYAVRFDRSTTVEGYEPDVYKAMYKDAPLDFWNTPDGEPPPGHESSGKNLSTKQINAMRREFYAENKAKITEQQRIAYHDREERKKAQKALNSSAAEETNVS